MSEELKNGDEVRIIATGQLVILDGINPHPDYRARDEVWAEATSVNGATSYDIDHPGDVELARRAADIPAKTLPTASEVVEHVSSVILSGFGNGLSFDETDSREPDGQLLAYGTSATGQVFGCRITITEIHQADF